MKEQFHASGICPCCDAPPDDEDGHSPDYPTYADQTWAAVTNWLADRDPGDEDAAA